MTKKIKSLNDDQLNLSGGEFSISGVGKKVMQLASMAALVTVGIELERYCKLSEKAENISKNEMKKILG